MAGIEGLSEKNLKKKCLVLGFEDVLVSGKLDEKVSKKAVEEIIRNLLALEKKFGDFRFFVVSGYHEGIARQKLADSRLEEILPQDHFFFVDQKYLDSMEQLDRERYDKKILENPEYKDEFFKQRFIENVSAERNIPKEHIALVGHDLISTAYYTTKYSLVDFALLKEALSQNEQKADRLVKGLTYIRRSWKDIRKLLLGKFPAPDSLPIKNHVENLLQREIIGGSMLGAVGKAILAKQGKTSGSVYLGGGVIDKSKEAAAGKEKKEK